MAFDPEQQPTSSAFVELTPTGKTSGEIRSEREPLIKDNHTPENYSVVAAIFPIICMLTRKLERFHFVVSLLGFSFQLWEDSFMVMKLVQLRVQPFHFR
ncbi:unnamed protein product [Brassica napus]|uniref:(rape) hypothetical protein n=1 Tax=Brassica napus TaxID=3708 RepID=A0A816WPL6_BRANA|nr:unnamed protein product [Brassica napus]